MTETRRLNQEQARAVAYGDGPLRIMAGAGTGKTSTLTERIARLVRDRRAQPSQILALTFTNKAAEELRERIDAAISAIPGVQSERVDIDTYHAFGGRVVAEHGHRIGLPPEPMMLTPPESWILLWRALDEIDFRHIDLLHMRGTSVMRSPLYDILNLGSRLRDELATIADLANYLDGEEPDDTTSKLGDFLRTLQVYERKKREIGAIDYGDQIALACELLGFGDVAALYQDRYRYLLVDEFQDTNYAQSILVRKLAGGPAANVCVVGDPNQAIYAFRGASPDNLDRFSDEEFPTAQTIELRQNFRSNQPILDVANAVWSEAPGPYRGNLIAAVKMDAEQPRLVECQAVEDEIAYIANEIKRHASAGALYQHIAVIVRKNAFKSQIYLALREQRIPCEVIGGTSLFETAEVRELISYLRAIGNPADDPSVAHVLCTERWGLDERALYELAKQRARGEPLIETARRLASMDDAGTALSSCVQSIDQLTGRSYRIGLGRLVEEIMALRNGGYDPVELANVQRFAAIVRAFAESRIERPGLADLLAYLDLLLTAGSDDEAAGEFDLVEANTVKIMTAHASKGLEWPIVFVAGASARDFRTQNSKDILPAALAHPAAGRPDRADFPGDAKGKSAFEKAKKAWEADRHDVEELRVFYVALTRARERLIISWSRTPLQRGKEVERLEALAVAAECCTRLKAGPAPDAQASAPAFRDIAPRLLATILPELAGHDGDPGNAAGLTEVLKDPWVRAGGHLAVLPVAVERFFQDRVATLEHLQVIKAIETRTAGEAERATVPGGAISYTQLDMYRACPHRYYLRYESGLPGIPSRRGATIGSAFHNAIATEATRRVRGQPVEPHAVRQWFANDLAALGEALPPATYGASGANRLINNYLASPDASATPLLVEAAFSLKLGDIILRGVVDRVHELPDGSIEVVDYKTDRQMRTEADVRAGWQLPIYLLACREVFTEIQPVPNRAVMFFVGANKRIAVSYTESELDAFRRELELAAARLRSVPPDLHSAAPQVCGACEFRTFCSYSVSVDDIEDGETVVNRFVAEQFTG